MQRAAGSGWVATAAEPGQCAGRQSGSVTCCGPSATSLAPHLPAWPCLLFAVINLPRSDQPGQTGVPAIETATLLIVVVTTLGLGSATGPLLRHFELEGKDDAALLGLDWTEDLRHASAVCCDGLLWCLYCCLLLPPMGHVSIPTLPWPTTAAHSMATLPRPAFCLQRRHGARHCCQPAGGGAALGLS